MYICCVVRQFMILRQIGGERFINHYLWVYGPVHVARWADSGPRAVSWIALLYRLGCVQAVLWEGLGLFGRCEMFLWRFVGIWSSHVRLSKYIPTISSNQLNLAYKGKHLLLTQRQSWPRLLIVFTVVLISVSLPQKPRNFNINLNIDSLHFIIELQDVIKSFCAVIVNKSHGPDNVCGCLAKSCAHELSPVFLCIFKRSLQKHHLLKVWKDMVCS